MKFHLLLITSVAFSINANAQRPCTSNAELDSVPGKYLAAAQYPWPAARAEYFNNLKASPEKATAKQVLEQIEKLEQRTRSNFKLTGGSWESTYSTNGYKVINNVRLADYRLQTGHHEHICIRNKMGRNGEYATVLRVYVNTLPINSLAYTRSMQQTFTWKLPGNDRFYYKEYKNYKPGVTTEQISLLNFYEIKDIELVDAINTGKIYYQDVPEKDIRQGTRDHITRYWFITKPGVPLLQEVTRKEFLESLLEYYEREKLFFAEQLAKAKKSSSQSEYNYLAKKYDNWETLVEKKKDLVNAALKENDAEWLSKQAVVNPDEDAYLAQKQKMPENTYIFPFNNFYDGEKKGKRLYKYNPAYFKASANTAQPQLISIAFRYIPQPSGQRLINNFTANFDRSSWQPVVK